MGFMTETIKLDERLVQNARQIVDDIREVEFAALFGSLAARGETYHDVDVALKLSGEDKYGVICRVIEGLATVLNVPEEYIDAVDLDRADLELKKEVVVHGVVLVDRGGYRERLVGEVSLKYPEYDRLKRLDIEEWLRSRDPSSIELDKVKRRLDFIRGELHFLEDYLFKHGVNEVKGSPVLRRLLERSFHLVMEAALDVCRHIVAVMGWGPALSYSDLVDLCSRHGAISERLKRELLNAIRLRNVIVHRYMDVDYDELYRRGEGLREMMSQFEGQTVEFIRRVQSRKA
ncbi:TPA: DUF86 domain-containing protein [Candidatus Bathyarchaeota archaeon]|nr:DUF86 domain-containing protein [Candidatus Bathyarchaeota archaeon]